MQKSKNVVISGNEYFLPVLKKREKFNFFNLKNSPGEPVLDLRTGCTLEAGFPDEAKLLDTAYADLKKCLKSAGIPHGKIKIITRFCQSVKNEFYRLSILPDEIIIEGNSTEGVRHGIFNLERLFRVSLQIQQGVTENFMWVKNRISRCFFSPIKRPPFNHDELLDEIDYYPDEYLNKLAHENINGLWLSLKWNELCITSISEPDEFAAVRMAKLNRTIEKCRRYGIKIWAFCIEPVMLKYNHPLLKKYPELRGAKVENDYVMCSSSQLTLQYIYESVRSLFSGAPHLGGIINISHGERATNCLSSVPPTDDLAVSCPVCAKIPKYQIVANVLNAMNRGMREVAPEAQIISWLYMPTPRPRADWVFELVKHIPADIILQYNFNSNSIKKQLGKIRIGGDYWLSETDPAPDFVRTAEIARQNKLALSAKLQVGCSHEVATVPFVPVPSLLRKQYLHLRKLGVSSVMQCWFFGNYPGVMNMASGLLSGKSIAKNEVDFLHELAEFQWGAAASQVVKAWQYFADGYRHYPLSNQMQYFGPMHFGVVWPLEFRYKMQPLAPTWKPNWIPSGDAIGECLENHNLEEVLILVKKITAAWEKGLRLLRPLKADFAGDAERIRDINVAEALGIQFASAYNIFKFYDLRRKFFFESGVDRRRIFSALREIAGREIDNSLALAELCKNDVRLGFHSEAEVHLYDASKLRKRIEQLRHLVAHDLKCLEKAFEFPKYLERPEIKLDNELHSEQHFNWRIRRHNDDIIIQLEIKKLAESAVNRLDIQFFHADGVHMPLSLSVNLNNGFCEKYCDCDYRNKQAVFPNMAKLMDLDLHKAYFKINYLILHAAGGMECDAAGTVKKFETDYRLNLGFFDVRNMDLLKR